MYRASPATVLVLAFVVVWQHHAVAETLVVRPGTPLGSLREKVSGNPGLKEVVFEAGVYRGGLYVDSPKEADASRRPLLIRAADGAKVTFEGAAPVEDFQPHENVAGVFWRRHERGGEPPKMWEPGTRTRYRLVADARSVARFPATYTVEGDRLLFHTAEGKPPPKGALLASVEDCGVFVNRPHVTV